MKLLILILVLILAGCLTWKEVLPPQGEFKLYTTIKVTDDWCYLPDGTKVNGATYYNPQVKSVSTICVSLKSDDPERTLQHELSHAWRQAVGLDPKARNQ